MSLDSDKNMFSEPVGTGKSLYSKKAVEGPLPPVKSDENVTSAVKSSGPDAMNSENLSEIDKKFYEPAKSRYQDDKIRPLVGPIPIQKPIHPKSSMKFKMKMFKLYTSLVIIVILAIRIVQ